jgi:hypothetical protein
MDGFKTRSISWTLRGEREAARLALDIAWGWHSSATGAAKPAHLAFEAEPGPA